MDQNSKSCKIEVLVTADTPSNIKKPYYWILWGNSGHDWLNEMLRLGTITEISLG